MDDVTNFDYGPIWKTGMHLPWNLTLEQKAAVATALGHIVGQRESECCFNPECCGRCGIHVCGRPSRKHDHE